MCNLSAPGAFACTLAIKLCEFAWQSANKHNQLLRAWRQHVNAYMWWLSNRQMKWRSGSLPTTHTPHTHYNIPANIKDDEIIPFSIQFILVSFLLVCWCVCGCVCVSCVSCVRLCGNPNLTYPHNVCTYSSFLFLIIFFFLFFSSLVGWLKWSSLYEMARSLLYLYKDTAFVNVSESGLEDKLSGCSPFTIFANNK